LPTREHHVAVCQQVLEDVASLAQRPPAEITVADLQHVERDVHRRGTEDAALVVAEEMKPSWRKREVWSTAWREISRTRLPSL